MNGTLLMRIISKRSLWEFWEQPIYADAETPLVMWFAIVSKQDWATPHDIKQMFHNSSILKNGRVVFNIAGNKYRLVVSVSYATRALWIKIIGTHKQYDEISEVIDTINDY